MLQKGVREGNPENDRKNYGNSMCKYSVLGNPKPKKSCSRVGAVRISQKRSIAEVITESVQNGR